MAAFGVPTLEDLPPLDGQRVLLRADFNVPVQDGAITDDLRIRAALPTIQWLQEQGATVVAATHFGRPKGTPDDRYSVAPIRARLAELAPGWSCSRTCGSTRGRRATTGPSSRGSSTASTPT